jgi:AcrR family transcriptional regulator
MTARDKRQQIVEAASECLARFGYDKTTLDDIAGRIGLNKTSLYYYYRNKESIFIDVIVQEAKAFLTALQAKTLRAHGCRNQVLTYLTERLRYYRHVVNLHNLSVETLQRMHPSFQTLYRDVQEREIDFIVTLLKEGMAAGQIKSGDAARLARIILAVTDAIKQAACTAPTVRAAEAIDYTQVEKDVVYAVSLMLDGLRPDPDAMT